MLNRKRMTHAPARRLAPLVALVLATASQPDSLGAQQLQGWDSPRVLELIRQARVRRAEPYQDSALVNYRAKAGGYVYFYLDREATEELTLVKVDQVALEVYWAYPGSTKQRIVGLRDESQLPNRMRYHLDHLTVVQNEFGDRIQLGDGDEVQSVVHPLALDSDAVYDFRLADSLSIRLGGLPEPLRVYEVDVRPVDPTAPGIVGSVFLDAATSDIVRMDFTFTRSSYVDRRLDYIRISLENGLWQGRFWLPFEQRVELRRQLPELDFPAGAVIRGHMRIRDYEFNLPLSPSVFRGPAVTSVPRSMRENYPFEEELYAELSSEGLEADADLEALRDEAADLIGRRFLDGLPRLRLDLPGASSVLRFDRTERLHVGAGLSYRMGDGTETHAGIGYSFGTKEPSAHAGIDFDVGGWDLETRGWWNRPRDLGYPAIAGVMNTLSSFAAAAGAGFGHDFRDSWFGRGGSIAVSPPGPLFFDWHGTAKAVVQRELDPRSLVDDYAADPQSELDRPLAVIDEGLSYRAVASLRRAAPSGTARGWDADVLLEYDIFRAHGALGMPSTAPAPDGGHGRMSVDWRGRSGASDRDWRLTAHARLGLLVGEAPVQRHFLLGGRGTVPGYDFRSVVGDRSALLELTLQRTVAFPWLSARLTGAAGWTSLGDDRVLDVRPGTRDGFVGPSVGAGVGLVNDILWLDLHRGLDDGDWELLLSVDRRLWDIL
ncbi:MAG TPA: hypothetical protein VMN78_01025 [Longimicrobiales bacterium]|nr:hypothetical protein [Longimicrobiales bacterium]